MDLDSVLNDPGDSEVPAGQRPLRDALARLDRRALEMARIVSRDPAQRVALKVEAAELMRQLDRLAEELEKNHPDLYGQLSDLVSESILDLSFVELDSDQVSLRLGEYLR
jgi:hypothetical protein